ncbi:MAG: hypothetical protein IID15_05025, partial [Candidatus Marinimicrobia bacterium]|nr:hypothetical protein [Candidatus Neomarinimicrobiota bacterium]
QHADYKVGRLVIHCNPLGRFYVDSLSVEEPVPTILESFVEGFSLYARIPAYPSRELGEYELGSAVGTLDRDPSHDTFDLRIEAEELGDIRNLLSEIRRGAIRPSESWENEQKQPDDSEEEQDDEGAAT